MYIFQDNHEPWTQMLYASRQFQYSETEKLFLQIRLIYHTTLALRIIKNNFMYNYKNCQFIFIKQKLLTFNCIMIAVMTFINILVNSL